MPWWGNASWASELARVYGPIMPLYNYPGRSPLFAFNSSGGNFSTLKTYSTSIFNPMFAENRAVDNTPQGQAYPNYYATVFRGPLNAVASPTSAQLTSGGPPVALDASGSECGDPPCTYKWMQRGPWACRTHARGHAVCGHGRTAAGQLVRAPTYALHARVKK